ncbi:MAG: phage tail assembly protein [Pseudomonadota bacterium]|jgi:hypothetical protein
MTEIVLAYPIKLASGKTLERIALRRAKVADLKEAARASERQDEQEIALLARLGGLVPEDLLELDLADYKALQDAFRLSLDRAG